MNDSIDLIFEEFLNNTNNTLKIELLKNACEVLRDGYSRYYMRALKLVNSNALYSTSFSKAWCHFDDYESIRGHGEFGIGEIFDDGLATLEHFLKGYIPHQKTPRKALEKLLIYLNTSLDDPEETDEPDECVWTVKLAQHLLSQLAVGCKYTIDKDSQKLNLTKKNGEYVCPCGKDDLLLGSFDDTSFGCLEGWHGSVDILMENLPITIVTKGERSDSQSSDSNDDEESLVEVNTSKSFSSEYLCQESAQCIVFSFLQKKKWENDGKTDENITNFLIPALGISKRTVRAHFYDCENDVLLSSFPAPLFDAPDQKNIATIVFLWLTLNYKWFCSGVTPKMLEFPCRFFEFAGPHLPMYENDVQRPAHKPPTTENDKFHPWCIPKEDRDRAPKKVKFISLGAWVSSAREICPISDSDNEPEILESCEPSSFDQPGCFGSKREATQESCGSQTPKRHHSDDDKSV